MKVSEEAISKVVGEASEHLSEDHYISGQVDRLRSQQPHITQYVIAHQAELSVEGVVTTLFHVALIHRSIIEATGSSPAMVDFAGLDDAATSTPTLEKLNEIEPNIASYIASNIDLGAEANAVASKILAHITKALLR
jgi:hypothetical protein